MEKIKLTELLHKCLEFKKDPTEEKYGEVYNIVDKFQIRTYLPLVNKQLATIIIVGCAGEDTDAVEAAINIHVAKTLYGILAYVTNLDIDIEFGAVTLGIVDILYEIGIIDKILEYCNTDYKRLESIYNEAFNFSNAEKIAGVPSLFSEEKLDEVINTLKSLKTDLTPEMLETIKKISTETSPEWQALKESVGEQIHNSIMSKTVSTLLNEESEKPEDLKNSNIDFTEDNNDLKK